MTPAQEVAGRAKRWDDGAMVGGGYEGERVDEVELHRPHCRRSDPPCTESPATRWPARFPLSLSLPGPPYSHLPLPPPLCHPHGGASSHARAPRSSRSGSRARHGPLRPIPGIQRLQAQLNSGARWSDPCRCDHGWVGATADRGTWRRAMATREEQPHRLSLRIRHRWTPPRNINSPEKICPCRGSSQKHGDGIAGVGTCPSTVPVLKERTTVAHLSKID